MIRSIILWLVGSVFVGCSTPALATGGPGVPVINEIMVAGDVRNVSGLAALDEDGEPSDWIELHNTGAGTADLGGYFLSDDPANLARWRLPGSTVLPPGGYLVVFASGKDRTAPESELHTNFRLAAGGEFLALTGPDGVISDQFISGFTPEYPPQRPGVSYGRYGSGFRYFERDPARPDITGPTPGTGNHAGFIGFAEEPLFNHRRGFYDSEFELSMKTRVPGSDIRYTTNGEWPDERHGTLYRGPVTINRTQPVRAVVFKDGWKTSNVVTHTYVFVDDVVRQDAETVRTIYEFPAAWGDVSPDYGLNQAVVEANPAILDSLTAVPSLSLVMDLDDLFNAERGIYSNAERKGADWERAVSLEIIDPLEPDGTRDIQVNSGVRIQGGAFRRFNLTRKNSLRLLFKREYGPSKLEYDLFPHAPLAAQEFDTVTLRMESNDGYAWENVRTVQYARDEFARRTALDLGIPAGHGRYVHVYINGVYWGLYNLVERPDAGFARSYLGARKEEWDGLNRFLPINEGMLDPWTEMLERTGDISEKLSEAERTAALMRVQGLDADGRNDPAVPDYIDVDSYIDYMLVNWYVDNQDWPMKNNYTGRQRDANDPPHYRSASGRASDGFRFFMWDAEASLQLTDIIDNTKYRDAGVAEPHKHMRNSEEYRVRFGDRVHRALFDDGALTPRRCVERYGQVTRLHTSILIPELARWGDQHGDDHSIVEWQTERDNILKNWCEWRTDEFLGSLRAADPALYPTLDAPEYDRSGGVVATGTRITVAVPESATDVFYTLSPESAIGPDWYDKQDPRLQGGTVTPLAKRLEVAGASRPTPILRSGAVWKYLDDGSDQGAAWRAIDFDDSGWKSGPSPLGYGEGDEKTVVGFIDVNPHRRGPQRNATTYFRNVVDIPDPGKYSFFELEIVFDDAYVVYVNGREVARQPSLPEDPAFDLYTRHRISRENAVRTLRVAASEFAAGSNTLAVEIHQVYSGSDDISFDLTLTGRRLPAFQIPESITENVWLKARSYDSASNTWSAMNAAFFSVDSEPASSRNLVISRIGFNPAGGDDSRYEYVELMNIDPDKSVDMTGVSFVSGIRFDFGDHTFIEPGGRIVIVNDRTALEERMGAGADLLTYGVNRQGSSEFSGNLNDAGERIALHSQREGIIHRFDYRGNPGSPAMDGYSLVLLDPDSAPDHGAETSWLLAVDPSFGN